jgi:acyl-CoA thioester hydrolase
MAAFCNELTYRVRYSDIDKMGTFYNSRALDWFEIARVELMRAKGVGYAEMEAKGFCLPLIEAHVNYLGRAGFDDLLKITTSAAMNGKARVRFDIDIVQADSGDPVARGHTVHAITDSAGRPTRPPEYFVRALEQPAQESIS